MCSSKKKELSPIQVREPTMIPTPGNVLVETSTRISVLELFKQIQDAKRVFIIEDSPTWMKEVVEKVKLLNPSAQICVAANLKEFWIKADLINESTVVLSDYKFPSDEKRFSRAEPNADAVHRVSFGKAKFFAILTSGDRLEPKDCELEQFRLKKDEFIIKQVSA